MCVSYVNVFFFFCTLFAVVPVFILIFVAENGVIVLIGEKDILDNINNKKNRTMKKLRVYFVSLLLSAVSVNALAYVSGDLITHDGIIYRVENSSVSPITVRLINAAGAKVTDGEVTIPSTFADEGDATFIVTTIGYGERSVNWPSSVKEIKLPELLEVISLYAFGGSSITNINVPKNVKTINFDAFDNANLLENISTCTVEKALSTCHPITDSPLCHPSLHFSVDHSSSNNRKCSTPLS